MLLKVTRLAAFGLLAAGMASPSALIAADPASGRVLQYRAESGETSFALVLDGKSTDQARRQRDHIVLFDTSASQTGEHRAEALAVLDSFVKSLPAGDQIRLFGIDVKAQEITSGFIAANSDDAQKALQRLARRAPLGATDLGQGLAAAIDAVRAERPASIVYFGDGMSALKLIPEQDMQKHVDRLQASRVPFNAYAVGPQKDLATLGVLANWSGGVVAMDDKDATSEVAGAKLADAATVNVFYPTKVTVEPAQTKLFPNRPLPVRGDREVVLLGKGTIPTRFALSDGKQSLNWKVSSESVKDEAFVSNLVQRAERQSLNVPFAGNRLLELAQFDFDSQVRQLQQLGDAALFDRNLKKTVAIAKTLQTADPKNATAVRLLASAKKINAKFVSQALQDENAPPPDDVATRRDQESLIPEVEVLMKVRTDQLQIFVNRTIEQARESIQDDPDAAIRKIKQAQSAVSASNDIDPDVRLNLAKRLQGVLSDIKAQKEALELKRIQADERVSAAEAQKRLISQMLIDDERMEQLIDRVRSLLNEAARGNSAAYGEAESVANAALNLRPGNGTATAAKTGAVAARQLYVAYYLRNLRADRFLETLEQVERSHVSFPDEPPIRWPAPEVWKALSERRKQFASVDLHKSSAAEKRIIAALDDESSCNFADTPLADAIQFLATQHEIPILLENAALEAAGAAVDSPVTLTLSGVPLRSVLNIMLKPLSLTYVIQDNVMFITTIDDANQRLQTRVYPVGDLAAQITPPQTGGALNQGLGGGVGGGNQQQGGGGFGGGGGGFGGGGGGGFFAVPPVAVQKAAPKPAAPKAAHPAAAPKAVKPAAKKVDDIADPQLRNILNGIIQESAATSSAKPFAGMAQVQDKEAARNLKKKP